MRAIVFEPPKFQLRDVPDPELPGRDWLKLRVLAVGVCGSDIGKILHGSFEPGYLQTGILGHEICGAVIDCGSACGDIHIGEVVAVEPLLPCARCEQCEQGDTQLCRSLKVIGRNLDGGFAEQVCIHRSQVHQLEGTIDPVEFTLADPLATVVHAFKTVDHGCC
jgi:threonine dehydrogenase-like Zn-dependent dehydrogenase